MKKSIALYGCGGFGREMLSLLSSEDIVFISDDPREIGIEVYGIPVLNKESFLSYEKNRQVLVTIANPTIRRKICMELEQQDISFATYHAPTHRAFGRNTHKEGSIFCDFTLVSDNVSIGRHVQVNYYSYIAHDCVIGDFVTFAPRVSCNGTIHIHDGAYIGAGAVIRQGTQDNPLIIGEGAFIGMGAIVTKNVPPYTMVYGNPARIVKTLNV